MECFFQTFPHTSFNIQCKNFVVNSKEGFIKKSKIVFLENLILFSIMFCLEFKINLCSIPNVRINSISQQLWLPQQYSESHLFQGPWFMLVNVLLNPPRIKACSNYCTTLSTNYIQHAGRLSEHLESLWKTKKKLIIWKFKRNSETPRNMIPPDPFAI